MPSRRVRRRTFDAEDDPVAFGVRAAETQRAVLQAKPVAERLIHALRMQTKRGKIAIAGKEKGAIVWPFP
jgi:hypothetical protein